MMSFCETFFPVEDVPKKKISVMNPDLMWKMSLEIQIILKIFYAFLCEVSSTKPLSWIPDEFIIRE